MSFPNFTEVIAKLRGTSRSFHESHAHGMIVAGARQVVDNVEREAAIQAVLYLYDHLSQHEQYREAVQLLAYNLPVTVREDKRIQAVVKSALCMAERLADPEVEKAGFCLDQVATLSDEMVQDIATLPQRAQFLLDVARIRGAQRVLEFGTSHGHNVMVLNKAWPKIDWIGCDVSAGQVEANINQAMRVGHANALAMFFTTPAPSAYGQFDLVAVLDTMEHTVHWENLLEAAEKYCHPVTGAVLVSTPHGAWSKFTDNIANVGPGQHVAVESLPTLVHRLESRGTVLHAQTTEGHPMEGNGNVLVLYKPAERRLESGE